MASHFPIPVALALLIVLACTIGSQSSRAADEYTDTLQLLQEMGATVKTNADGTLRGLVLDGPQFTGHSLDHVKKLTELDALYLRQVRISDADVKRLASLPHLKSLIVGYSSITDEAVPSIASMKALRRIDLYGTQLTPQGIARLRESRPDLIIGRGGILGVGFRGGGGLEVATLLGSAKKSDLRIGDVVTHCNGNALNDFDSLAKIVRDSPPGRELSLSIRRADGDLAIKVAVGELIDMLVGASGTAPKENATHR